MGARVPDHIDRYVGSRVRMRRLMLDMSQEKLGNELGITFQQVQKYEKGTNRVSASRLQVLSQILQVSVQFFFEGDPQIAGRVREGCRSSIARLHLRLSRKLRRIETGQSVHADQRP